MILFAVFAIPIALCIVAACLSKYDRTRWLGGALFFGVVAAIVVACLGIAPAAVTYGHINDLRALERQQDVAEERRDNYTALIEATLAEYPEYERQIVGEITPEILLSFPNLRANESLRDQVEQLVAANDRVYAVRDEIIAKRQAIEANSNNPLFVKFLWWPS